MSAACILRMRFSQTGDKVLSRKTARNAVIDCGTTRIDGSGMQKHRLTCPIYPNPNRETLTKIPFLQPHETYCYFGALVNLKLDWTEQYNQMRGTIGRACQYLASRAFTSMQKVKIINHVFIPNLQYRSHIGVFTKKQLPFRVIPHHHSPHRRTGTARACVVTMVVVDVVVVADDGGRVDSSPFFPSSSSSCCVSV